MRGVALAALLLTACTESTPERTPGGKDADTVDETGDDTITDTTGDTDTNTGTVTVDPDSLDDMPCAQGRECAAKGPYLDDTCCTEGDAILPLGSIEFIEIVDVETDGEHAYVCSGFGFGVTPVADPTAMNVNSVVPRCQRIAVGPVLPDGAKLLYFTHHGDGHLETPHLWAYRLELDGRLNQIQSIPDAEVLFEGLDYFADHLYVASHGSGVQVYLVLEDGTLTWRTAVEGFDNALKVEAADDILYVADEDHVRVVDISNPGKPAIVQSIETDGKPRDIDVWGDRVYVALGIDGLQIFDRTTPDALVPLTLVDTDGSVQAVDVDDRIVALSNWNHVSVLDTQTLVRLGTEQTLPAFEQDFGIATHDGRVYVGEWETLYVFEHRPGYVAADIWAPYDMMVFAGDEAETRDLLLQNRGPLDLEITDVVSTGVQFVPELTELVIEPGEQVSVPVSFEPPSDDLDLVIEVHSNDPDDLQNPLEIPLYAVSGDGLGVGDRLTDDFAFLDPTGENDLANLEGKVLFLAYFALF